MVLGMDKRKEGPAYLHLCYAGLSVGMFVIICPCLMTTLFLMEAPWSYLTATQVLYTIVVCLYVFHILLDLAIIIWCTSDKTKMRTVIAIVCPVAGVILTLPTAGMLLYTKDRGGFSSTNADAALVFSILVVPLTLLHMALVFILYRTQHQKKYFLGVCCPCLVDTTQEDTSQLPTAGGHSDIIMDTSIVPERLDAFEPVIFHSGQRQSVHSDGNPDSDSYVVIPSPLPPPPPTVKRSSLPPTSPAQRLESTQTGQTNTAASTNQEEDSEIVPSTTDTTTHGHTLQDISIEVHGNDSMEPYRSENEIDHPTVQYLQGFKDSELTL